MKKLILIIFMLSSTSLFSQNIDDYIELLRTDLKSKKTELISENINFTDSESQKFWPIYREYSLKLDKINDNRVKYIKEFADNFDKMTDKKADEIIKQAFDFYKDRRNLEKKLYDKSKKVLGEVKAASLIQLEHDVNLIIDLQLSSQLPLIKKTLNEPKEK